MEMINCEQCGRVFNTTGFFKVCQVCLERDEQDFSKIKEYLSVHPCAKIFEVVSDLSMPLKKIKRYLRESRLEIIEKTNHFLFCEMCGKPIRSGQYCDECYKEFHRDFKTIYIGNLNQKHSNKINLTSSTANKTKMASSQ